MALTELKIMLAIKNSIGGRYNSTKKCQKPKLRALGIFSHYNIKQIMANKEVKEILDVLVDKEVIKKLNEEELDILKLRSHADMYMVQKSFAGYLSKLADSEALKVAGLD